MDIRYPEIGVCGLSCRLCPSYNSEADSRCGGCKSASRMAVGCPFITCGVKKRQIEYCGQCPENTACEKWRKHREASQKADSFKCYQTLESDIAFIEKNGLQAFEAQQKIREDLLKKILMGFNDGRSKSYFCIAATVMTTDELQAALEEAKAKSANLPAKEKAKLMHSILDRIARDKGYLLKLRR